MTINGLLKKDNGFFKASLKDGKVNIEITKSAYSINFNKENTLADVFGFNSKILTSGKSVSKNHFNSKAIDNIFTWCNLIDGSYVNNRKLNSIYKFRLDDDEINQQNLLISIEPAQLIYHKVTSRPNKIIIKLIDINNNLIEFDNMALHYYKVISTKGSPLIVFCLDFY